MLKGQSVFLPNSTLIGIVEKMEYGTVFVKYKDEITPYKRESLKSCNYWYTIRINNDGSEKCIVSDPKYHETHLYCPKNSIGMGYRYEKEQI